MPEPNEAGESTPTEQTASTPSKAVETTAPANEATDKQTTTQPRAEENESETTQAMMNALGIDPAIQAQISEKETEPRTEATTDTKGTDSEQQPDTTSEAEPEAEPDAEPKPEETEEEEAEEEEQPEAGQKPDKRQKRINRLTRQKGELETKLDLASAENQKLRDQLQQGEKAAEPTTPTTSRSRLSGIMTEPALDKAIETAEGWVEWCDANADGVNQGEGDNQKFIGPKDIAAIRRENEKVILLAPNRRDQIRETSKARSQFETISQQAWPELFDEKSDEHRIGEALEKTYPFLIDMPQRHYAIGLLVEGMKSLHARVQAAQVGSRKSEAGSRNVNGNGEPRAISEKAFAPRAPIAPSRPDAPTREVVPSSKKKLNQAVTDLVAGGGRESLVAAIAAMEESDAPNKSPSDRLVKS